MPVSAEADGTWGELHEPPAGYRLQSEDGGYAVGRRPLERWSAMEPHEKAAIVTGLTRATHEWARIGLAERWPRADDRELDLRLAAFDVGRDWMLNLTGFDVDAGAR
jgi:hypothetical protein